MRSAVRRFWVSRACSSGRPAIRSRAQTASATTRAARKTLAAITLISLASPLRPAVASDGYLEWARESGNVPSVGLYVAVGPNDSVYVSGHEGQILGGNNTAFLQKHAHDGAAIWNRAIDPTQFDPNAGQTRTTSVRLHPQGHSIYLAGVAQDNQGFAGVWNTMFVQRFDAFGTVTMTRQFDRATGDWLHDIAVSSGGSFYVVGEAGGIIAPGYVKSGTESTAFIRRYTAGGIVDWTRQFGTASKDVATGVAVAPDGTILVTGWTEGSLDGPNAGQSDVFVRRYDLKGILLDKVQFGTNLTDRAFGITSSANGTVYVVGDTFGSLGAANTSGGDLFVRALDSDLQTLWTYQYGLSDGSVQGRSIEADLHGSTYVGGSQNDPAVGPEGLVLKISPSGGLVWLRHLPGLNATWGLLQGISLSPDAALYAVGGDVSTSDQVLFKFAPPRSVLRYAGSNRFDTAATLAARDFKDPSVVSTVFIAVGNNFPDALAGAAAAGTASAPLLLVNPASIPDATITQLQRLKPSNIIIVGGETVITPAVANALGAYGTVSRLAGPNRYATAVEISKWAHPNPAAVTEIVVATGTNFPDALGGGPVAFQLAGPVLLVPPEGTIPETVTDEIQRLNPTRITVLGGEGAISPGVMSQLSAYAATIRVASTNRYATAVNASKYAFNKSGRVYVAVGTNFPDALAGAAAAARYRAPILLVPPDTVPTDVANEITRLGPHTIVILGGTSVISTTVENALRGLLGI